jgi:hypothetical protein
MYEELKSQRVPMAIEEFVTLKAKSGRRGSPRIPAGTTLYAIRYVGHHGYFTYSYSTREAAQDCINRMIEHNTDNEYYLPWNMSDSVQNTLHVGVK